MEIRYPIMIFVGCVLVAAAVLFYIRRKPKQNQTPGRKIANLYLLEDDAYFQKKQVMYKIGIVLFAVGLMGSILSGCFLLARPYKTERVTEKKYSRDIILCLDVSTSVDYLNKNLVKQLIGTVENMKDERFGIVIFNTSPVLLSPLTDDYEYTIEQLKNIEKSLKIRLNAEKGLSMPDDWMYWDEYISGGTLVGNEERGSSIIGDGLAACINNFPASEEKRTKIVIFSTDNDLYGEPIATLPEAAQMCKDNGIIVYGIGTKEMYSDNLQEMKLAMEVTGGKFYLEEESGTFKQIVQEIDKQSTNLVKGKSYVYKTDQPMYPFLLLLCSMVMLFGAARVLRR